MIEVPSLSSWKMEFKLIHKSSTQNLAFSDLRREMECTLPIEITEPPSLPQPLQQQAHYLRQGSHASPAVVGKAPGLIVPLGVPLPLQLLNLEVRSHFGCGSLEGKEKKETVVRPEEHESCG